MFWKIKYQKARSLKKALRYLDPHHALWDDKELESFYVEREGIYREEIPKILKTDPYFPKFLLSGPPGSGKSTELGQLKKSLGGKFHFVLFSARDMTNNFKISIDILLVTILAKIGEAVKEKKPAIYEKNIEGLLNRQRGWETKYAELEPSEAKFDPRIVEQIEHGQTSFTGQFKQVTRLEGKPTLNEIIGAINKTADELLKRRCFIFKGKKILLLISDLDKINLESAREIFIESSLALTKLNVCGVFTFPLALKYEENFIDMYRNFNHIYFLESFPIHDRGGKANHQAREHLKLIVTKRIKEGLVELPVLEQMVRLSGGIPFELLNILRECIKTALRKKYKFVDIDNLQEALGRMRSTYLIGLTEHDKQVLTKVAVYKERPEGADLTRLLNQYWITEYGSYNVTWYDINPILVPLIKETRLFTDE